MAVATAAAMVVTVVDMVVAEAAMAAVAVTMKAVVMAAGEVAVVVCFHFGTSYCCLRTYAQVVRVTRAGRKVILHASVRSAAVAVVADAVVVVSLWTIQSIFK
jgi:hypothetical protein